MVTSPSKTCPKCGEVKLLTEFYIIRGRPCGWCKVCMRKRSHQQAETGYFRQRRAEGKELPRQRIPQRYEAWTSAKFLRDATASSRRRGHEKPSITSAQLDAMIAKFKAENYCVLERGHPFSPSLDRIDSSRGYHADNVRVVWLIENYAKNNWHEGVVVEFAKRKLGLL